METARSWLENCRQNHALCEPVDPAFNPTRLLYIHDASSVQLIETEKEAKSHAYVAFSHCWGESETLKLFQDDIDKGTRGNIEKLRSLIQVQRLPTSYQEAISVSLALGFRHIWIDSLCIIQNSHDDWAKESAMMKDVYANCSLDLCASAAADSSEASFQHRDSDTFVSLDIEPRWTGILNGATDNGKLGPLPAYLRRIKFRLVNRNIFEWEINDSPLNLRAWVVQERALSRRHLFMTCHQLWWECRAKCASEVFPAGVPDSFDEYYEADRVGFYALGTSHYGAVQDTSIEGQTDRTKGKPSEVDMDRLWKSLVKLYSRCELTYSSDKLPALSGLAQAFSSNGGFGFSLDRNSYLAGLWQSHLPGALCWRSVTDKERGQVRRYRPHPYRAPSWSWASVEGPVTWDSFSSPVCCVVDAKVLHEDERYKAAAVKGGILHLRSFVVGPLTYTSMPFSYLTPSLSLDRRIRGLIAGGGWSTYWDEWDEDTYAKRFISYLDPLPHTVQQDGSVKGTDAVRKRVWLEDLAEEPRIRLFLVPINKTGPYLDGLILCQVVENPGLEGVDEGTVFQRVGSFYNMMDEGLRYLIPERIITIK